MTISEITSLPQHAEAVYVPARPRSIASLLLWVVTLLLAGEVLLQLRSHILYGQSIFNVLTDTTFQIHPVFGIKLLRPNSTIVGSKGSIASNSLGLRSPEIARKPADQEFRIAIVGASSIFGTYVSDNTKTSAYQLEKIVRERFPHKIVSVINAGIPGYTVANQIELIERILIPLQIDLYIWYPGSADLNCVKDTKRQAVGAEKKSGVELNRWSLTYELLRKNTQWLRRTAQAQLSSGRPVFDVNALRRVMEPEIRRLYLEEGAQVLVVPQIMSFRRDMPPDQQYVLSRTARFYRPCFTPAQLIEASDARNAALAALTRDTGSMFLDVTAGIPGGNKYFGDASHFSEDGERLFAQVLADFIFDRQLLQITPNDKHASIRTEEKKRGTKRQH